MKLDRNVNGTGRGKYGLVNNRKLLEVIVPARADGDDNDASMVKLRLERKVRDAIKLLEDCGILDWGNTPETEFFLIRLKDKYANVALHVYAQQASKDDTEYAADILELSRRAGPHNPHCKKPD